MCGSAPPALAQHDWIHVLADYGSTVEFEIEVFGFIARANPDFGGFSLIAMVPSLFETGDISGGAGGFFERDAGHISRDADRMGIRLGDAMSRGKRLALGLEAPGRLRDSDQMAVDWFGYANRQLDELQAEFCVHDKSERAVAAGSAGPWQRGGISPFQLSLGKVHARRVGRTYSSWGAQPAPCP
jgi:hypothetical protein